MRLKDLIRIILICCLFANTTGLIFIADRVQKVFLNWQQATLLGFFIFCIECLIFFRLLKPYAAEISCSSSFSLRKLLTGVSMALVVWIALQLWLFQVFGTAPEYPSAQKVSQYGILFLVNALPNALIEEFIFRFLPVHYAEKKGYSRQQLIGLSIGVALIFSLSHVSVYLFRDHTALDSLYFPLLSAFFYGMVYFFIYILTGNLYFTTLIHAFSNQKLLLINTPEFESFYFYTFIFIALIWFGITTMKTKS